MTWWLALTPVLVLAGAYLSAAVVAWFEAWEGTRPVWAAIPASAAAPIRGALRLARRPARRLEKPDGLLLATAPGLALVCVVLSYAVIPVGPGQVPVDLSLGLFFFIVILGPLMVALMNAGWATNGTLGVIACFRAAAHIVAYEVPFGFAVIGPAMMAQSLSTVHIVEAQSRVWFALLQPGSFLIYLASAPFISYRYPFDLPFAGEELAGGVTREYSCVQRAIVTLARHALLGVTAAVGTVSFLGGWEGPLLPPPLWFALKTLALIALFAAAPLLLPRLRLDQMLALAWKVLLPVSLVNIILVGVVTLGAQAWGWIP
jgi:NADH-quinone oxidoreductase subunit H